MISARFGRCPENQWVPGNSAFSCPFWDGENVTPSKVVGDLHRVGIKRSRLESPALEITCPFWDSDFFRWEKTVGFSRSIVYFDLVSLPQYDSPRCCKKKGASIPSISQATIRTPGNHPKLGQTTPGSSIPLDPQNHETWRFLRHQKMGYKLVTPKNEGIIGFPW